LRSWNKTSSPCHLSINKEKKKVINKGMTEWRIQKWKLEAQSCVSIERVLLKCFFNKASTRKYGLFAIKPITTIVLALSRPAIWTLRKCIIINYWWSETLFVVLGLLFNFHIITFISLLLFRWFHWKWFFLQMKLSCKLIF